MYLGADLSSVTAATINDLRKAVAVQQYYEALARGGSRYREQVQALWDVVISDKTVQVPEYLGGGRYHVNMNQIVQTSGQQTNDDTPIGETGAMSVTPINESSFTKSFEEHGFVIGVCCVRHNHSYQQGLERFWSRTDRLDYYVPQFANLGEQPVKRKKSCSPAKKAMKRRLISRSLGRLPHETKQSVRTYAKQRNRDARLLALCRQL